jgi:hypothetical protein
MEVLEFILMIVAQVHRRIQLFEIDKPVLNNFSPNRPRDRFVELLLLHNVNNCIDCFLGSEELA